MGAVTCRNGMTLEQRELALTVLARHGGNSVQASRELREQHDLEITDGLLRQWRNQTFRDRYTEIQRTLQPQIERQLVGDVLEGARAAMEVQALAMQRTREQLESGQCKDPASTGRNVAVQMGIDVDTVLKLEGRPTQIVEHKRDADEILRSLNQVVPNLVIDGTAVEIPAGQAEDEQEDPCSADTG